MVEHAGNIFRLAEEHLGVEAACRFFTTAEGLLLFAGHIVTLQAKEIKRLKANIVRLEEEIVKLKE